ncbi:hypothetical protein JD844_000294 [Phrynosoma platyrhinos]|uniref:CARMIL C-terminal domain-containing protein n=1 Tax=Phrynosoma platyrhinos TaxID=52577 RepID=A0ABQ7SQD5_PHRPL|nr:hypothetical protein JD844_000294 [Phrynosoma platyrhinos]
MDYACTVFSAGFDSDMVTLVLAVSRSRSIKHVALGRNFNISSRATLADTLHRIVQLTQDDDCSVESISVADSHLKLGTGILLDGLGSRNSCLAMLDISGNAMGDLGAKILAKALSVNTTLRNFTLKMMPLPMSDVALACRSHPKKMEEVVHKILPILYEARSSPHQNNIQQKIESLIEEVSQTCWREMQSIMQAKLDAIWSLYPQILQKAGLGDHLICNLPEKTVLDQLLTDMNVKLMEIQLSVTEAMAHGITDKALEELTTIEDKLLSKAACYIRSRGCLDLDVKVEAEDSKIGAPQAELSLSCASSAKSRPASTKDAEAGSRLLPCTEPASQESLMDLPTAGEKLEHYTRGRPRPNRRNRQPPSRPKVQPPVRENDEDRSIARLDEGLDEFFTKKVIHEAILPVSLETFPGAATSTPSGSRTFKKKIGHFFAFKKPKSSWSARPEKEPEGSPLAARGRKLMLSDILRTPSKASESTKALSKSEEGGLAKRPFEKSDGEMPVSFEHRVHVMLQRIGVTKVLSSEGKNKQAQSKPKRGDIVDSSAESPPCSLKSRTHSMSTEPSVRINTLDVVGRTGTEPSSGSSEGRLSWRALGRQLNAELKGKCSELSSSPRRACAIQEPASPREQKGKERWSSSLPRIGRCTAGHLPHRRTSNAGEGHSLPELQHSYADVSTIAGDNQLKPKPRLKPVASRRAMSVHEEQLRDQACAAELHHAKIPLCLQRSPILKWKMKPKSLLEPETSAPTDSPCRPSQERNMVATESKPRAEMEELELSLEQILENTENTAVDQRTAVPLSKSSTHEH